VFQFVLLYLHKNGFLILFAFSSFKTDRIKLSVNKSNILKNLTAVESLKYTADVIG